MKATMVAGLLGGLLLLAWAPAGFAGAPAGFAVRGTEVQVRRTGDSADVRIVYDLSVNNVACGWLQAEFDALPGGAQALKAALLLDGKEFPAVVEGPAGERRVQAFQDWKHEGRRAFEKAKSVQLALSFPTVACPGPEMSVPLPIPRETYHHEEAKKEPKNELPRLSVRFDAEVEGATAEIRATFRSVPAGSRLVLRSDPRSAGASVLK